MKQCFGYVRVSTVKQGDGVSLEAQREAIIDFASRNDIKITRWFEEKVTAAKKGRPLFNKMVSELKRNRADGVVFHKIDRSARNFADWARIGDLSDAGIGIHFVTETLDFQSRGGRMAADIQAVVAADYIRNLREEIHKGIKGRLKQGLYPFQAPIGYLNNGGGNPKTIDPIKGPLVRKVFELYASGEYSLWSIAPAAEATGLRSSTGKPLGKTSIEQFLRNPFYVGVIEVKSSKQVYQGIHEPLISAALFEQVKTIRSDRDNKKSTKHNHRYRGLLRCGYCTGAMIPELQKGKVYYRCHQAKCETKTLREDVIESGIQTFLKRYALTANQTENLRQRFMEWLNTSDCDASARAAKFELAKLEERLSRLTDKMIDDLIDQEAYKQKKQEILIQQTRLRELVANFTDKATKLERVEKFLEQAKSLYLNYMSAANAQRREIVKSATSNRLVFGKKLELEPSNWVLQLQNVMSVQFGADGSPASRTVQETEWCEAITDLAL